MTPYELNLYAQGVRRRLEAEAVENYNYAVITAFHAARFVWSKKKINLKDQLIENAAAGGPSSEPSQAQSPVAWMIAAAAKTGGRIIRAGEDDGS